MSDIRIGIVGAGGMAEYHVAGFRAAGAEVTALADVDAAAAKSASQRLHVPATYPSLGEMLRGEKTLDGVSIITPNKFHHPLTLEALEAGKHVFCEKPPALNAAEIEAMRARAENAGLRLMFDFNNRARPEAFAMMDYIRSGEAGRINSAQALWIRRTGIPGFGGWFTRKDLSGGGPVIDLLHMIDLALYFMDYPTPRWVLARTFSDFIDDKNFKGPWGIPDGPDGVTDVEAAAHGLVTFDTGQVLFLRNSWAEMNRREEVSVTFQGARAGGRVQRLFGRDGIDETSQDTCEIYVQEHGRSVNRSIVTPPDPTMGRERAASNFVRTLRGEEAPLNHPGEAVALMKIIDALYASAASGAPAEITA